MRAFNALVWARTVEFFRDTGSFAWSLISPVVLIVGFAFAFSGSNDTLFKVGVLGPGDPALAFLKTPQVQFIAYGPEQDRAALMTKVRQHNLDALIDTGTRQYWTNDQSKNRKLVELLLSSQAGGAAYTRLAVSGAPIRYVDWFVPGVIALNLMFGCLFGVGYTLIRYRKNGVLKRMKATPVSALTFIAAQGVSRFFIVLVTSALVFVGTDVFLHFRMAGSWLDLLVLLGLGNLAMIALGLALASRFKNEELANGVINLLTWPMMLFSGVFFSLDGTPAFLQSAAQVLPLTHFIQAARAVMLEGQSLLALAPDVLYLSVFTAVCLGLAAWLFRWD